MKSEWRPILAYRDFYDVPRLFFVEYRGRLFLFGCPFVDSDDDYAEVFRIYRVPPDLIDVVGEDWLDLPPSDAAFVKEVDVRNVEFDADSRSVLQKTFHDTRIEEAIDYVVTGVVEPLGFVFRAQVHH